MYYDDNEPVLAQNQISTSARKEALGHCKHQFFQHQLAKRVKGSAWNPSQVITTNLKDSHLKEYKPRWPSSHERDSVMDKGKACDKVYHLIRIKSLNIWD